VPYDRGWEETTFYDGYRVSRPPEDVREVADPADWKGRIAATMPGECVCAAVAAIKFYTATIPKVALDVQTMTYLVESEGYRIGPAGTTDMDDRERVVIWKKLACWCSTKTTGWPLTLTE